MIDESTELWQLADEARQATDQWLAAAALIPENDCQGTWRRLQIPEANRRLAAWQPSGTHEGGYSNTWRGFESFTMADLVTELGEIADIRHKGGACCSTILGRTFYPSAPGGAGLAQYRGACLRCGWVSDEVFDAIDPDQEQGGENLAVEAALDHCWPGWRDMPIVAKEPGVGGGSKKGKGHGEWYGSVLHAYGQEWIDGGGPVLVDRERVVIDGKLLSGRHVPTGAPGGGYRCAPFGTAPAASMGVSSAVGQQLALAL